MFVRLMSKKKQSCQVMVREELEHLRPTFSSSPSRPTPPTPNLSSSTL
jgi:hypothetical protein